MSDLCKSLVSLSCVSIGNVIAICQPAWTFSYKDGPGHLSQAVNVRHMNVQALRYTFGVYLQQNGCSVKQYVSACNRQWKLATKVKGWTATRAASVLASSSSSPVPWLMSNWKCLLLVWQTLKRSSDWTQPFAWYAD